MALEHRAGAQKANMRIVDLNLREKYSNEYRRWYV